MGAPDSDCFDFRAFAEDLTTLSVDDWVVYAAPRAQATQLRVLRSRLMEAFFAVLAELLEEPLDVVRWGWRLACRSTNAPLEPAPGRWRSDVRAQGRRLRTDPLATASHVR